nr:hypothetical protein [Candidatus Anoxychlamydiales bacterium]
VAAATKDAEEKAAATLGERLDEVRANANTEKDTAIAAAEEKVRAANTSAAEARRAANEEKRKALQQQKDNYELALGEARTDKDQALLQQHQTQRAKDALDGEYDTYKRDKENEIASLQKTIASLKEKIKRLETPKPTVPIADQASQTDDSIDIKTELEVAQRKLTESRAELEQANEETALAKREAIAARTPNTSSIPTDSSVDSGAAAAADAPSVPVSDEDPDEAVLRNIGAAAATIQNLKLKCASSEFDNMKNILRVNHELLHLRREMTIDSPSPQTRNKWDLNTTKSKLSKIAKRGLEQSNINGVMTDYKTFIDSYNTIMEIIKAISTHKAVQRHKEDPKAPLEVGKDFLEKMINRQKLIKIILLPLVIEKLKESILKPDGFGKSKRYKINFPKELNTPEKIAQFEKDLNKALRLLNGLGRRKGLFEVLESLFLAIDVAAKPYQGSELLHFSLKQPSDGAGAAAAAGQ